MERFIAEFPDSSSIRPTAVASLSTEMENAKAVIGRAGVIFSEAVMIFCLTALTNAQNASDPRARKKSCALLLAQLNNVKNGQYCASPDKVHKALWKKAEVETS